MDLQNPQNETVCNPLLPEELIVEILLRLPVSFLLQFKCVCKSWKTLISDRQFAKTHLGISTADPSLVTYDYRAQVFTILTYPLKPLFKNQSSPYKPVVFSTMAAENMWSLIIGSCNGLVCLFDQSCCATLCNPSTRLVSKQYPAAVSDGRDRTKWKIECYGFGYDQLKDKYKVLIVFQNRYDFNEKFTKIYTFGEDSWKTIQNFAACTYTTPLGKFVSGTLNWVVYKNGFSSNQCVILSFDLNKETYAEVLLPQYDGGNVPKLCVSSNGLCVFENFCFETETLIHIFRLMTDYGVVESWMKFMMNPPTKYFWGYSEHSYDFDLLFVSESGVVLFVNNVRYELVLYDLNSGRFDCLLISGYFGLLLLIYHESLVSPHW